MGKWVGKRHGIDKNGKKKEDMVRGLGNGKH